MKQHDNNSGSQLLDQRLAYKQSHFTSVLPWHSKSLSWGHGWNTACLVPLGRKIKSSEAGASTVQRRDYISFSNHLLKRVTEQCDIMTAIISWCIQTCFLYIWRRQNCLFLRIYNTGWGALNQATSTRLWYPSLDGDRKKLQTSSNYHNSSNVYAVNMILT